MRIIATIEITKIVVASDPNSGVAGKLAGLAKEERSVRYWSKYEGNTAYGFGSVWSVI